MDKRSHFEGQLLGKEWCQLIFFCNAETSHYLKRIKDRIEMKVLKNNYIWPTNAQDVSKFCLHFGCDFISESQQFLLNGSLVIKRKFLLLTAFPSLLCLRSVTRISLKSGQHIVDKHSLFYYKCIAISLTSDYYKYYKMIDINIYRYR